MTASSQLYPLATQDGKAIPLDCVKPVALLVWNVAIGAVENITIPADIGAVAYVYATQDVILKFGADNLPATLVEGTSYEDAILIPSHTLVTVAITPGEGSILNLSSEAAAIYFNVVEQWAALAQATQTQYG